ncbi:MAG: sugar ABC transporter permease [Myxococcota bacterium]|nr:sugar ABC transporter permease [Myxococcota bacterium]
MNAMAPNKSVGFVGPSIAVLLASTLAAVCIYQFGTHHTTTIVESNLSGILAAGKGAAPDALKALNATVREAGYQARIVGDDAAPRKYAYLPRLFYRSLDTGQITPLNRNTDRDDARAWRQGLRMPKTWMTRSGYVRAAGPVGNRSVLIVDGPKPHLGLGTICTLIFGAGVLGLILWLVIALRMRQKAWAPVIGAGLAGVGILAAVGVGVVRLDALMAPVMALSQNLAVEQASWGTWGYPLAAVPLLPLIGFGYAGFINRCQPSPHRLAYAYVLPAVLGLTILVLIPFLFGIILAFLKYGEGQFTWVGLTNFVHILASSDYPITHPLNFYFTLGFTVLWTGVNVALHLGIGLALALVLHRPDLKFKGVYRVLLIIPWAVPSYITALIWKGMFNKQFGLINELLGLVGVEPIGWFSGFWTGFAANLTTNTWLGFPFMMVVALGALQSIPSDLYEAAEVDGATKWQQFKAITLPLLRPALLPAVILGTIWTFNMFNIVYLVSGGQPDGSTDILITEAYRWAFEHERYGYAAAYSFIIFGVLLTYSLLTQKVGKTAQEARA